jgi:hypothetical protein
MLTLRELFHSLSNILNKISLASGITRDDLEFKALENLSKEELKDKNQQIIDILKKLEQYVIEADQILKKIKGIVYSSIDPDKEG